VRDHVILLDSVRAIEAIVPGAPRHVPAATRPPDADRSWEDPSAGVRTCPTYPHDTPRRRDADDRIDMTSTSTAPPTYVFRGGERWRNPWDDYRALRDHDPVHRSAHPEFGEFWVLSRHEHVFDAVRDHATFSSAQGLTLDPNVMDMFEGRAAPIVMMDPPEHTAMRRLVSAPMTPRRVASIADDVARFIDRGLDDITASGGSCDIIETLFKPLPSFLVAHYLGVPLEDRERFDHWTDVIVAANAAGDITAAPEAALELFTYGNELVERRRREPGDDLVSELVRAGEDRAGVEWIVGFVFTMVTGGNDTATGLLGGTAELLTAHRDQRALLIEDPSLIGVAVDEFLRLTSPVQNLARTTTTDVTIDGVTIPAGRKVLLLYGAANRDPRVYGPDADELDVTRAPERILSLGYGAHHCLGASVARLAARITIERLLDRFPDFSVDAAQGTFAPGMFIRRYDRLPFRARD
jgi:cytochrome P450